MDREQFVAVDAPTWWLLERDLDHWVEDLRRELGASFGWTEPTWYTEKAKVEELYDFIVGQGSQMLYELDQASDDDRRHRWLGIVMASKRPPQSASASIESAAPTRTGINPTNGAAPRKSAFGSKSQPEPTSGAAVATSAAATIAPNNPTPGRKSIFKAKSQPEPGTAGTVDSSGAPPGHVVPTDEHLGEVDQQIQTVMSELSADDLAAIASDLGLSPSEVEAMVQEPDFAALVAEEQAHSGP